MASWPDMQQHYSLAQVEDYMPTLRSGEGSVVAGKTPRGELVDKDYGC
jgi:hypothetical protein